MYMREGSCKNVRCEPLVARPTRIMLRNLPINLLFLENLPIFPFIYPIILSLIMIRRNITPVIIMQHDRNYIYCLQEMIPVTKLNTTHWTKALRLTVCHIIHVRTSTSMRLWKCRRLTCLCNRCFNNSSFLLMNLPVFLAFFLRSTYYS